MDILTSAAALIIFAAIGGAIKLDAMEARRVAALRSKLAQEAMERQCANGVCEVLWKPEKPR